MFKDYNLVYLDTSFINIIDYEKIDEFLNDIKNNKILFVYSIGHILDLKQASNPNENLKKISKLTNNICIIKYWGENDVKLEQIDPFDLFNESNSTNDNLELFYDMLEKILFIFGINNINEIIDPVKNDYSKFCKKLTTDKFKNINNEKNTNVIFDNIKLQCKDIIRESDEICKKDYNINQEIYFDYILLNNYYMIDDNKNITNTINDGMHVNFASYCDLFVSCDKRQIKKCEKLFEKRNILTKVIYKDKPKN